MTPGRRHLSFASLNDVMPDVDRLLGGYKTVGRWTLGQICNHLAMDFRGAVEGYDFKAPWIVRKLIAPGILRKVLKTGEIPEGARVPASFLPKPNLDDRAEAEALRATLHLFKTRKRPLVVHPFFGPLSDDQWNRLLCLHCAHHLSFAEPNGSA